MSAVDRANLYVVYLSDFMEKNSIWEFWFLISLKLLSLLCLQPF